MIGKLKETQANVEATKQRLNSVLIDDNSSDNLLKVTLTANRELKTISIFFNFTPCCVKASK